MQHPTMQGIRAVFNVCAYNKPYLHT